MDELLPASPRVAGVRPQRGLRAALPVSRLEDGRRRQRGRDAVRAAGSGLAQKVKHTRVPGRRKRAASSGSTWARRTTMPPFEPPRARPRPDAKRHHRQGSSSPATGRRCSRARSTPRTARRCIRPTCRRRASTARRRPAPRGRGRRPTRRRGSSCSRPSYGFRYAAIRRPIKNAATNDYVRVTVFVAPFTVLIPPNNLYNVANVNVPIDDTHTMFYFIAWSDPGRRRHRPGGVAQVLRRAGRASTSTRDYRRMRTLATTTTCRTGRR